MQEDWAFRYLAGGLRPEHKTLREFWRRHGEAIEELFTQVLGWARKAGMARLGRVAMDARRIKANASPARLEKQERQQVRRWRREMESADPEQEPGMEVEGEAAEGLRQQMSKPLATASASRLSRTDPMRAFCANAGEDLA